MLYLTTFMKYHSVLIIQFLLFHLSIFGQDAEAKHPFNFYIGIQTRVTPIYPKGFPDFVTVPDRNIFEQPNKYLSGPSLLYRIEKDLNNSFDISFSHALRYDFLYQTFPFNSQPFLGFRPVVKKALISDVYLDGEKKIVLNNSTLKIGIGLAMLGFGSSYLLTQRFTDNNNQSFYITSKEDFIFPAVTTAVGWQKKDFSATLKIGFAWYDPTLLKRPFLFPELKVQYKLFSF